MLCSFGTPGEEEEEKEGHGDLGFVQLWRFSGLWAMCKESKSGWLSSRGYGTVNN